MHTDEKEEIDWKPTNLKELLTEMKDSSELIVDLAYAALIFNSQEIGEEVADLEEDLNKFMYDIRMTAMLATRTVEDAEQLTGILQVASATEKISNAARDIVRLLETEISDRPFLPFMLKEADEKINMVYIGKNARGLEKNLGEHRFEEMGVHVIAVKRRKTWIYDPEDHFRLRVGDRVILRGVMDGVNQFKTALFGGDEA